MGLLVSMVEQRYIALDNDYNDNYDNEFNYIPQKVNE